MQNEVAGMIYQKIPAIMADLGAIEKTQENSYQNYAFRGIEDVLYACQPIFIKHGVFIVPNVTGWEYQKHPGNGKADQHHVHATVGYTFYAEDGSCVSGSVVAESMDSSDKAAAQTMSAAFKAFVFQILCVPTEDNPDSDYNTPQTHTDDTSTEDDAEAVRVSRINQLRAYLEEKGTPEDVVVDYLCSEKGKRKLVPGQTLDDLSNGFLMAVVDDEERLSNMVAVVDEWFTQNTVEG
jgi:hypothetical protein